MRNNKTGAFKRYSEVNSTSNIFEVVTVISEFLGFLERFFMFKPPVKQTVNNTEYGFFLKYDIVLNKVFCGYDSAAFGELHVSNGNTEKEAKKNLKQWLETNNFPVK